MKILVAGYPYIRETFLKTFDAFPDEYVFILPKKWKAKAGSVIFKPPSRANIETTKAFFYHSNYPILGGILKGLMPLFPFFLWRYRACVGLVYSPLEPILLSTLYQAIWAKIFGKRHYIFTWENVSYSKFKGLNGWIKNIILRLNITLSDGFVCGNHKAEEIIRAYTEKPTVVIPLSGVDTDFYNPDLAVEDIKIKYGLERKFIFSFIGALGYRKGVHLIIDAFRDVCKKHPDAHLLLVGSGEYGNEIEDKIKGLDLNDRTVVIPWASSALVRDVLSATDVFLYPSFAHGGWEEQFGYSIAEAMSMSVPVISTNSGSIDELINDGENSILIEQNNAVALKEAMERLIEDTKLRDDIIQIARPSIIERYSFVVISRKYKDFFSSHERS